MGLVEGELLITSYELRVTNLVAPPRRTSEVRSILEATSCEFTRNLSLVTSNLLKLHTDTNNPKSLGGVWLQKDLVPRHRSRVFA